METLKHVGAAILGVLEGVLIAIFIMFVAFLVRNEEGAQFTVSTGWCVLGGIIGAVVCACYPPASLVVFSGLVILIRIVGIRDGRD